MPNKHTIRATYASLQLLAVLNAILQSCA